MPRLPLRAKVVLVMWAPIAAMYLAVLWMYWLESAPRSGEMAAAAYRTPAELLAQVRVREAARLRHLRGIALAGLLLPLGALAAHLVGVGRATRRLRMVGDNAYRLAHGLPLEPLPGGADEIALLGRQLEDAAGRLRESQGELNVREKRYRDLFDCAAVPYEETDREGMVRHFNQEVCALLKCGPGRILGSPAWDFVVPDQREKFRAAMLHRMATGSEPEPFECEFVLDDGSTIAVEIRESLIRNEAGDVTGVLRSMLDVTERKLAVAAARKVAEYAMELRNKNEQLAHALDTARSATDAKIRRTS